MGLRAAVVLTIVTTLVTTVLTSGVNAATAAPEAQEPAEVRRGQQLYDEVRFEEARMVLEPACARADLTATARLRCLRYLAFSLHYLSRYEEARLTWQRLLSVDPSHRLDPMLHPPELVGFFDPVKPTAPPAVAASTAPTTLAAAVTATTPVTPNAAPPANTCDDFACGPWPWALAGSAVLAAVAVALIVVLTQPAEHVTLVVRAEGPVHGAGLRW